jgi:proline dehydrogenase
MPTVYNTKATMEALLQTASSALRKAALHEDAKEYILTNPPLFAALRKAANRYIGGETLNETIEKVKFQNKNGFKCSIEFIGESTRTEPEANTARNEFIAISRQIKLLNLNATISLDLSHIGLAISRELCLHNLDMICREAATANIEVIISAEDTGRTDAVLYTYYSIANNYSNISITLQAYLHRTKEDFEEAIKYPGRIRIVKGAFETPAGLSIPRGEHLDTIYLEYIERLLAGKHLCSIATHHDKIQQAAKDLILKYTSDSKHYEFESLYGIQNQQLQALKDEGFPAKLYFVYGNEWYLYLCNRLAEYPLNVFQAITDIVE